MRKIFLGVDIGSSKSHALIADEHGRILGFGEAGPGNHEVVGYEGLQNTLKRITKLALQEAGIDKGDILAAAFGVSGYDWPSEYAPTMAAIQSLELSAHLDLVNDTLLGLIAGSEQGWGIAVVAGSGENCWGRDALGKIGRMTGCGSLMGEYGGAFSIAAKSIQAVAAEWAQRSPTTSLTQILLEETGAPNVEDLLEGLALSRYYVSAETTPRIFRAAEEGDPVAIDVVAWAAEQLAGMVGGVIHQLGFQELTFDVIETGGVFKAGSLFTDPFHTIVKSIAHGARFITLQVPPVNGAVLLAMEQTGQTLNKVRKTLLSQGNDLQG